MTGEKYKKGVKGLRKETSSIVKLKNDKLQKFIDKIEFKYIESININIPQLVDQLTSEIIDVEYKKTKMTESKKALKTAYDDYTAGLQEILNVFSLSISETFSDFRENWSISFNVPKQSETFRDLISDDIELYIDDKGCTHVDQKGSGLQRLSVILLHFEILKRLKSQKSIIVCVDEPDIYLHEGLQRKLNGFFKQNSKQMQILYTTHSKIFINQYDMKNIVLLSSKIYSQYSARKKRNINVSETILIDTNTVDGYEKVSDHLGLEKSNYEMLDRFNVIVEGECDEKYLKELGTYFNVDLVKIISLNGVDNCDSYLKLYDSYYKTNTSYKPIIKVILDNDSAGRNVKNKIDKNIKSNKYSNIDVTIDTLPNFNGNKVEGSAVNHEIEDFIYPEVLCYLVNLVLSKMQLKNINTKKIIEKINKKSFSSSGILALLEHEKNDMNPSDGNKISFTSSSNATSNFKNSLANMFKILGEKKILDLIKESNQKYPRVQEIVKEIFDFR